MYICYLYSDSEFHNEIGLENTLLKKHDLVNGTLHPCGIMMKHL